MRYSLIVSCVVFLIYFPSMVFVVGSQEQNSLCFKNIGIGQLLDTLSNRYGVYFSYQASGFPVDSLVTLCGDYEGVNDVLGQLFDVNHYDIIPNENQIIIKSRVILKPPSFFKIHGLVTDAESHFSLAFVHVGIVGSMQGTVTNNQGEYVLYLPDEVKQYELRFSTIGYESKFYRLPPSDTTLMVPLVSANVRLPEVKISYAQANDVIGKFFDRFQDNYLDKNVVLSGFFRESIFQDHQLIQISEAAIDVDKGSYDERESYERVCFVKGRKSRPPQVMNDLIFKLEGGPYHFSRIDVAKYWDFLPHSGQTTYFNYVFNGVDYEYGKMLFRIGFKPINDDGDLKYCGELFFDSESYALVRVHFELTRKSLVKSRHLLIRKESRGVDARLQSARYVISYRPLHNKWVLGSVTGLLQVKIKSRLTKVDDLFTASSELVINDIDLQGNKKYRFTNGFKPNYQMYEKITAFDSNFWETSNIVLPDFLSPERRD